MTLQEFSEMVATITDNVNHYYVKDKTNNYIVWAEDSERNSLWADNEKEEQIIQGTLDYFTKTEFDPVIKIIQEKFTTAGLSWSLNSVQFEDNTGYIHHEWIWEVDSIG